MLQAVTVTGQIENVHRKGAKDAKDRNAVAAFLCVLCAFAVKEPLILATDPSVLSVSSVVKNNP